MHSYATKITQWLSKQGHSYCYRILKHQHYYFNKENGYGTWQKQRQCTII